VCKLLGVELEELEDWNCCGASSAHSMNEVLAIALPARNLEIAEKKNQDLVVPCAACYQRLKVAEHELVSNPHLNLNISYQKKIRVRDLLEFIHDECREEVRQKVKKPLKGLKAVCYYGCLTMRPPKITGAQNYEAPVKMDELMEDIGIEVYPWSYKTDCCGGSLVLTRPDIVRKLVNKLYEMALEAGADCVISACPLCQGNLDQRQEEISKEFKKDYYLPIFYFTELMGLAMGSEDVDKWMKRHLVDPRGLLRKKGLI
jgi:heterodisulfide reductase subunit B